MSVHLLTGGGGSVPPAASGMLRWGTRYTENSNFALVSAHKPGLLIRHAFNWSGVQQNSGDPYNWSGIRSWVNAAKTAGLQILAVVGGCPEWATRPVASRPGDGPGPGQHYPIEHQEDYYAFCAAAVQEFPEIDFWEIFNEPNQDPPSKNWTAARVGEILNGAARAMVAANPNAKVGGISRAGCLSENPAWTNTILAAISGAPLHFLTWHDYARPRAPELASDGNVYDQVADSIALCRAGGFTGKFMITEFGYPTTYSAERKPGYTTEENQARWLVRQQLLHVCFPDLIRSVQFQLKGSSTDIEEGGMGLIRGANDRGGPGETPAGPAGSFKPGYYACQTLYAICDGSVVSYTAESRGPLYRVKFIREDGRYGYVVWTTAGTQPASFTGLPANVRVTQLLGTSATVATTSGALTITAGIDPQYVEVI